MRIKTGIRISRNERVYQYTGYTYGVVTGKGVAVTDKPGYFPFYEIPKNDVEWDGHMEIEEYKFEEALKTDRFFDEWSYDVYKLIPNMSLEELPEVLVHRSPLIRAQARARMLEINYKQERLRKLEEDDESESNLRRREET